MEVLIVFIVIGIPTLAVAFGMTVTSLAKQYFQFKTTELETRQTEAAAKVEMAKLVAIPTAADAEAWRDALAETRRLTGPFAEG
ncbi:MAG: hypothetical protein GY913_23640 [Proteobacteria bacterium]|nr:hypothetical protein [Pseudomonadota bacterium]MCP4919907.1 hypothetical protein [Pseudomonadota bacterium]